MEGEEVGEEQVSDGDTEGEEPEDGQQEEVNWNFTNYNRK